MFENTAISFKEALEATVELIPQAFQYPQAAKAKISFDEQIICTPGYERSRKKLSQQIVIGREKRGIVEVVYPLKFSQAPEFDFHFLEEEEQLLKAVARHLTLIFEKNEAIEKGRELEAQIRHADRLATIGQLAAGIAHELNNPLVIFSALRNLPPSIRICQILCLRTLNVLSSAVYMHARSSKKSCFSATRCLPGKPT